MKTQNLFLNKLKFILPTGVMFALMAITACDTQNTTQQKNRHSNQTSDNIANHDEIDSHCSDLKYHWSQSYPIPLYFHESFPTEYIPIFKNAMARWESTLQQSLFTLQAEVIVSSVIPDPSDKKNVIYWITTTNTNLASSEQGRVEFSLNSINDQILEADMLINATFTNFQFFTDTPRTTNDVHLESLFIHELGHMLGLKHSTSETSVMKRRLKAKEQRINITSEDVSQFHCK